MRFMLPNHSSLVTRVTTHPFLGKCTNCEEPTQI